MGRKTEESGSVTVEEAKRSCKCGTRWCSGMIFGFGDEENSPLYTPTHTHTTHRIRTGPRFPNPNLPAVPQCSHQVRNVVLTVAILFKSPLGKNKDHVEDAEIEIVVVPGL